MRVFLPATVLAMALWCGPALADDSAMGQLNDATNGTQTTGTTFDGCTGACSGMDVPVDGNTNVPPVPEPTPVDTSDGDGQ